MNPLRLALLRDSFGLVSPIAAAAAAMFYGRLMETDPSTRPLFAHSDMTAQGAKLMQAIAMAVASLERPDVLVPKLQEMARRHVAYGVERSHYASVGAALIWTLREGLGAAFTREVEDAWTEAFAILSDVMMDAAYTRRAA